MLDEELSMARNRRIDYGGYDDEHRRAREVFSYSRNALENRWRRSTFRILKASPSRDEFQALAEQWHRETLHASSITKKVLHPSYQRIMAMGKPALPWILDDLHKTRSHWLWALHFITGKDPAEPSVNFNQAVDAWLQWGLDNGLLSR